MKNPSQDAMSAGKINDENIIILGNYTLNTPNFIEIANNAML